MKGITIPNGLEANAIQCTLHACFAQALMEQLGELCHFIHAGTAKRRYSILARFDCDLSLDIDDPTFKSTGVWHRPEVYFEQGLSKAQREERKKAARQSEAP